jgi:hypothetical protein
MKCWAPGVSPNVRSGCLSRCKGLVDALAFVGCSLLSGPLVQPVETAGADGVCKQIPVLLIRLWMWSGHMPMEMLGFLEV